MLCSQKMCVDGGMARRAAFAGRLATPSHNGRQPPGPSTAGGFCFCRGLIGGPMCAACSMAAVTSCPLWTQFWTQSTFSLLLMQIFVFIGVLQTVGISALLRRQGAWHRLPMKQRRHTPQTTMLRSGDSLRVVGCSQLVPGWWVALVLQSVPWASWPRIG